MIKWCPARGVTGMLIEEPRNNVWNRVGVQAPAASMIFVHAICVGVSHGPCFAASRVIPVKLPPGVVVTPVAVADR